MTSKITVTNLTMDEIVCLIADAFEATQNFIILNDDDFYDNYANTRLCRAVEDGLISFPSLEDKIAAVLMNGGGVTFIDTYGEGEIYHDGCLSYINGDGECCYNVFLNDILRACSTPQGYVLANKIFNEEDYDSWDAYRLLQLVIFGEEIYG